MWLCHYIILLIVYLLLYTIDRSNYLQIISSLTYYLIVFPDSKQNMNNLSSMTNKIELLTNSLSDPDFIGTSIDGMN